MNKRNRSNKQNSTPLTRWLDRLNHFDIPIYCIVGIILNFTDYLSRNPVEGATVEENYDEEYVITKLAEQPQLNIKYGPLFADRSKCKKIKTETNKGTSEERNEKRVNQSHMNNE